jgi:hypothetical protein
MIALVKHDARPDLRASGRIILAPLAAAIPTVVLIQLDRAGVSVVNDRSHDREVEGWQSSTSLSSPTGSLKRRPEFVVSLHGSMLANSDFRKTADSNHISQEMPYPNGLLELAERMWQIGDWHMRWVPYC